MTKDYSAYDFVSVNERISYVEIYLDGQYLMKARTPEIARKCIDTMCWMADREERRQKRLNPRRK